MSRRLIMVFEIFSKKTKYLTELFDLGEIAYEELKDIFPMLYDLNQDIQVLSITPSRIKYIRKYLPETFKFNFREYTYKIGISV